MKKIFLVTVAMVLFATMSFAAPWVPTALELSTEEQVEYAFDGTLVDITFDVVGKPARIYLNINTRLPEAAKPVEVVNGHLGWHYVNKIDTTVYISAPFNKATGLGQKVSWDGYGNENDLGMLVKNSDPVAPGTYDYYLFGYDNVNPRQKVCEFMAIGWYWEGRMTKIVEDDESGMPMAVPLYYGSTGSQGSKQDPDGNRWIPSDPRTLSKWILGSDPDDIAQLQTSALSYFNDTEYGGWKIDIGCPLIDPTDHSTFMWIEMNNEAVEGSLVRFTFVDGGLAERDEDWGGPGVCTWISQYHRKGGEWIEDLATDNEYLYAYSPGRYPIDYKYEYLWMADMDAEQVGDGRWMVEESYEPENPEPTLMINASGIKIYARKEFPRKVLIGAGESCFHEMLDVSRLTAGLHDTYDISWWNVNGDYFLDRHWDPDGEIIWMCNSKEPRNENGGRTTSHTFDKNFFMIAFMDYHGLDSFTCSTQDGSGMGYNAFADDAVSNNNDKKGGGWIIDNGSSFDGLYVGPLIDGTGYGVGKYGTTHWIPYDSCHGVITSEVGVEEEAAAAFSVAQNNPNPFNPTTTISYKLAEAGDVTVDIYNVAGQKIDTLVNDFQTKGTHSIVWDASGFSAGVYFFTVKTSDFSKTMKMTLLK